MSPNPFQCTPGKKNLLKVKKWFSLKKSRSVHLWEEILYSIKYSYKFNKLPGFVAGEEKKFGGCELGWFRFQQEKCVNIFDTKSSYDEGSEYCQRAFGARMLNVTSDGERKFWSFHLFRYSNISANVWLEKETNFSLIGLNPGKDCLALMGMCFSVRHRNVSL